MICGSDSKANELVEFADSIYKILNAENKGQIQDAVINSIAKLGFVSFNLGCERENVEQFMTHPMLTTWSDADLASYLDLGFIEVDPLLQYLKRSDAPLIWEQAQLHRAQPGPYTEMLAERQIHGGAVIPLPAGEGRFSSIAFLAIEEGKLDDHLTASLARSLGAAVKAQMLQLGLASFDHPAGKDRFSILSDKQIQVLHWLAMGKSNTDIAVILEMTPKQVNYHVQEILRKLDVSSRVQAAILYSTR